MHGTVSYSRRVTLTATKCQLICCSLLYAFRTNLWSPAATVNRLRGVKSRKLGEMLWSLLSFGGLCGAAGELPPLSPREARRLELYTLY